MKSFGDTFSRYLCCNIEFWRYFVDICVVMKSFRDTFVNISVAMKSFLDTFVDMCVAMKSFGDTFVDICQCEERILFVDICVIWISMLK